MTKQIPKFLTVAMLLSIVPYAQAQEHQANHNLGSATDVWRVELKYPEHLLAMSAGDSDGVSELHEIEIRLTGTDGQFHSFTEANPWFRVNDGPRKVGEWIGVRQGDRVKLDNVSARDPDTYNLWVHTKQVEGGSPALNFQIIVTARELDCRGDNVCRRGDTGIVTYSFNMPVPANRSLTCLPDNKYRISVVNGATMKLSPIVRGRDENAVTAVPQYSGSSTGPGAASGTVSGPHLALQSGEICIAATRMLPTLPDVRPEPRRIPRRSRLQGQR